MTELHRPLMSAMRAMVNNITRAIGIYFGGVIMSKFTYNTPYAFTIIFYLIGTSIFFSIFKDKVLVKKTS